MRQISFYIAILLFFPLAVTAQSGSGDKARGGSAYSSIGVGIPVDIISSYTDGMGVSGVSVYNPFAVNGANPAMWGLGPYSQGTLTVGVQSLGMQDFSGTSRQSSVSVDRFQVVLPVIRSRLGMSVGFVPVTRTDFSMVQNSSIHPEPESGRSPINIVHNITGSGGVNRLEFGLGWRIANNFSAGYAGSVLFASRSRNINLQFDSERFNPMEYTDTISGVGTGHRFGIFGRNASLFGQSDEISFGGTVTLPATIGTDRTAETFLSIGGTTQAVDFFEGTRFGAGSVEIPLEFNVGVTYNPLSQLSITGEYLQQHWDGVQYSYNRTQEQYFSDRIKLGGGVQYHPYRTEGASGIFSSFRYSAGVSHDTGHLKIDNQRIETLKFHAGIGILSPQQASSVDLGFYFGFRGTESQDLVRETIWGLRLSLNLAEWMFQQSRFD